MTSRELEPLEPPDPPSPDAPALTERLRGFQVCPRCGIPFTNNIVLVTDPQTAQSSTRCCTPNCGWRDDDPDASVFDGEIVED